MTTMDSGFATKSAAVAVALVAIGLIPTSTASAAPLRDCGNYGFPADHQGARPIFTQEDIVGAGVYDITTRVTRCRIARRMVRGFWNGRWRCESKCRRGSYHCRNRRLGEELSALRCRASGERFVRFRYGA